MAQTSGNDRSMVRAAMAAPYLEREEEHDLAVRWVENGDDRAMHKLIAAHMRLVISIAARFRHFGLPMSDMIQEGHVGLLEAARRFEPAREVRFSTYATWWIRAAIQDYILRNWSIVRGGTSSTQKALFFNLRRVEAQLQREAEEMGETLDGHQLRERVAQQIGVSLADVEMMTGRLSGGDMSLNARQSGEDEGREWIETLMDDAPGADETVAERRDQTTLRGWLAEALSRLTEREQMIVRARKLSDAPRTLDSLGEELNLSKERVRQIEAVALGKMRRTLEGQGAGLYALLG